MPALAKKACSVINSPIRAIVEEIEKSGDNHTIISFGGGASNISPSPELIQFLKHKLDENPQQATAYGSTKGHYTTRSIISNNITQEQGIVIDPAKEIMLTTGSTEALFLTFLALIEPGDEVILTNPTYCYAEPLELLGAKIKQIAVNQENGFQINLTKVNEAVTKKTKLFLLLSPDNPTGRVASKETVKELVALAEKNDFWIISDETYKDIIYDKQHYAPRLFGGKDNVITCCSFSKVACIPGLRIGYLYGPEHFIQVAAALRQYTTMFPSKPAQLVVEKFLENNGAIKHNFITNTVLPEYKLRRHVMNNCLKKYLPQGKYLMPEGAFYFFVDISYYMNAMKIASAKEFSEKLLLQERLVTIPGSFFGANGENYLRLTFVAESEHRIIEGFERFKHFIDY